MAKLVGKDPGVFLRYHGAWVLTLLVADGALAVFTWPRAWALSPWHVVLTPLAVYLGALFGVLMHNAGHSNFKPRFVNRLVLELMGLHQLDGWRRNTAAHIIHHKFPDDPLRDPHPPLDVGFWRFAGSLQKTSRACLARVYADTWGEAPEVARLWRWSERLAGAGIALRVLFWFLLLGPALFFAVYLPSWLSNGLFFAHLNYFTHRPREGGGSEILNLDDTVPYRIANTLLFGTYYHKNHHRRAYLFNPKHMGS